jgi:hypothetical protein
MELLIRHRNRILQTEKYYATWFSNYFLSIMYILKAITKRRKYNGPRKGTNSGLIGSSETAPDNDNKAEGYGRE